MNVSTALKQRKSVRAFTTQNVSDVQINNILDVARCAPSGTNTQPWEVAVVTGAAKQKLQTKIESAFRAGKGLTKDYDYYPNEWISPFRERRKACGLQLYSTLNIKKEDKQKRVDQWAANYRAFDAPVMLFFFIDPILNKGSYLDYGMFIQSIMLAAVEQGLATCPQAALAEYPQIVKEELGYGKAKILLCGMALGYEDKDQIINQYRTPRVDVNSFTHFFS